MSNPQILLVEDEHIVAMGIAHELRDMGYVVPAIASSGREAIEQAEASRPDLVLMDIVLKGELDGVETTELLQERLDVPVVYLTAYADEKTLARAKTTAPYGYLLKPYEEKELRTTIEVALYKHRLQRVTKEMQRWRTAIFRSIGDALIVTDSKMCVRMLNPAAEQLTGWTDLEAFGQPLKTVFHTVDERNRHEKTHSLIREAAKFSKHLLLITRTGKEIAVQGSVAPIRDERSGHTGHVLVFRDITEQRLTEAAIKRTEQQLQRLRQMESFRGQANSMAHDFNQVVSKIVNNLSLLLSSLSNDDPNRPRVMATQKAALYGAKMAKQLDVLTNGV